MVIRRGLIGFSISLAGFALMHSPAPAFPIGFCLGVFYFMAANSMATVFQQNLKDDERATMMPLWFMAFGGTVAVSGLAAGPIIDVIGTQSVLLFGAAFALFLSWWSNLDRLPSDSFLSQP
jgi:MFS family permease